MNLLMSRTLLVAFSIKIIDVPIYMPIDDSLFSKATSIPSSPKFLSRFRNVQDSRQSTPAFSRVQMLQSHRQYHILDVSFFISTMFLPQSIVGLLLTTINNIGTQYFNYVFLLNVTNEQTHLNESCSSGPVEQLQHQKGKEKEPKLRIETKRNKVQNSIEHIYWKVVLLQLQKTS